MDINKELAEVHKEMLILKGEKEKEAVCCSHAMLNADIYVNALGGR